MHELLKGEKEMIMDDPKSYVKMRRDGHIIYCNLVSTFLQFCIAILLSIFILFYFHSHITIWFLFAALTANQSLKKLEIQKRSIVAYMRIIWPLNA